MSDLEILRESKLEDLVLKLPDINLDRKEYLSFKKMIEKIGGKWKGGKIQGFIFKTSPNDKIKQLLNGNTIDLKKDFQYFPTPKEIADKLVSISELKEGLSILEPSAGQGSIINSIHDKVNSIIDCYELMDENLLELNKLNNIRLVGKNFLECNSFYDRIIANPPFTKNQDIDHVLKMYDSLNENGILVSIMSSSWYFGNQKKQKEFKNFLDSKNAIIEVLPEGTFKSSGTNVVTTLVKIKK